MAKENPMNPIRDRIVDLTANTLLHPDCKNELSLKLQSFDFRVKNILSPLSSTTSDLPNIRHIDEENVVTTPYSTFAGHRPRFGLSSPQYHTHLASPKNPLTTSNDDVRSAALALTSLSLSPANISSLEESLARKKFAFPPNNTPTDEDTLHHGSLEVFPTSAVNIHQPPPQSQHQDSKGGEFTKSPPSSPHFSRRYYQSHLDQLLVKPRSYSTNRDNLNNPPFERVSKQRSYSFDAVGRSHKYYNNEENQASSSHCHSPLHREYATSADEGIGTSEGGSSDSLEISATASSKRKLNNRAGFRCMWRGCDKELSTLSGIILHVRHAHIGVARAGEEEFYFDDINNGARVKSRVSSTSSNDSLPESTNPSSRTDNAHLPKLTTAISIPTRTQVICDPVDLTTPGMQMDTIISSPSDNKRSKPVSVIQPVIPVVRPREFQITEYDISNLQFTVDQQHTSMETLFANPDKKQRRRKHSGKKKCRKVYGMSNKDLWCTQCRWKKACVRFM